MYLIDNSKNKTNNFAGDIYGKIRTKPFTSEVIKILNYDSKPD